ncbi:MAG: hypothetical protein HN420_16780, partial [Rhodospirillaceae bacterium]|nr:hypothetical protein [Rhodospirillaceae bacterium]
RPPIASVLTCLELAPGYVIGRTEGELYSVRVAGPVCGPDQLQQLESGVDEIATPLLVVLTHTDCGVLRALAEDRLDPSLSAQLAPALHHALDIGAMALDGETRGEPGHRNAAGLCKVEDTTRTGQAELAARQHGGRCETAGDETALGIKIKRQANDMAWHGIPPKLQSLWLAHSGPRV